MSSVTHGLDGEGARTSNTGHSTYKSVACGVDTLVLSVRGEMPETLEAHLCEIRTACQSAWAADGSEPEPVDSGYSFAGEALVLLPHGRKSWRYVLHNRWVDVQLGRGGVSGVCASVRLSAAYLWSVGVDVAAVMGGALVRDLCGADAQCLVSEVHVCRDVAGRDVAADWADIRPALVTRAVSMMVVEKHRAAQTIAIGARSGAVSAVLYDKLAETHVSHKEWMHSIWSAAGWDGDAPVWRLEFRLRRDFLRSVGINTIDDLLDKVSGCWRYAVDGWLRHVCEIAGDSNRWRWPLSAWWGVYSAEFDDMPSTPVVRDTQCAAEADDLVAQAAGCLVGVATLIGSDLPDDVVPLVLERLYELAMADGLDWADLVARRGRRYAARR